jgi:hypothetical protein
MDGSGEIAETWILGVIDDVWGSTCLDYLVAHRGMFSSRILHVSLEIHVKKFKDEI